MRKGATDDTDLTHGFDGWTRKIFVRCYRLPCKYVACIDVACRDVACNVSTPPTKTPTKTPTQRHQQRPNNGETMAPQQRQQCPQQRRQLHHNNPNNGQIIHQTTATIASMAIKTKLQYLSVLAGSIYLNPLGNNPCPSDKSVCPCPPHRRCIP